MSRLEAQRWKKMEENSVGRAFPSGRSVAWCVKTRVPKPVWTSRDAISKFGDPKLWFYKYIDLFENVVAVALLLHVHAGNVTSVVCWDGTKSADLLDRRRCAVHHVVWYGHVRWENGRMGLWPYVT